jgi:hypothetical protein
MGDRYWLWVVVRLAVGVAIVAWAMSYLGTGSAEKEFQKTQEAMKQVRSFRVAFTATPGTQHNEMLWEVDCNRNIEHSQSHLVDTSITPPAEFNQDEVSVGGVQYNHQSDGSWAQNKSRGTPASFYCGALARGDEINLMPKIATMIKRGILQKGDKKTVNGVRCREWHVAMKGAPGGLEHDTVCLGVDDHLPYELTVDWERSRTSFSDYNAPIQFDVPEAALQPASATTGSN